MYTVYILTRYGVKIDMTTNSESKAKLRMLELEHSGCVAYYE